MSQSSKSSSSSSNAGVVVNSFAPSATQGIPSARDPRRPPFGHGVERPTPRTPVAFIDLTRSEENGTTVSSNPHHKSTTTTHQETHTFKFNIQIKQEEPHSHSTSASQPPQVQQMQASADRTVQGPATGAPVGSAPDSDSDPMNVDSPIGIVPPAVPAMEAAPASQVDTAGSAEPESQNKRKKVKVVRRYNPGRIAAAAVFTAAAGGAFYAYQSGRINWETLSSVYEGLMERAQPHLNTIAEKATPLIQQQVLPAIETAKVWGASMVNNYVHPAYKSVEKMILDL